MKHAAIIDRHREPLFEPPPRFTGLHDRRLGGRVAAEWERGAGRGRRGAREWPDMLASCHGNLIRIECRGDMVTLHGIGSAVAAAFDLQPGPLSRRTAFERALGDAVARSVADDAPARFEGGYSRAPEAPATLLTRGVVVLLADDGAARTACAVVTWTELLAPGDSDNLRRELLSALAAPRHSIPPGLAAPMW